jgi:IS605 OrfB family transposase
MQLLLDTAKAYTSACNLVSEWIFRSHSLIHRTVHDALYLKLRNDIGLKSQMAESVFRTVIARYRAILTNQKEWIRPVFHAYEYDLVWNRDYSLLKNGEFSVNSLKGRIKAGFHINGMEHYFEEPWKFGTAKLVHKHGKLFLHISVTREMEDIDTHEISTVVGIDRGIRFLTASYDSNGNTVFISGNEVKQKRAHYKALRKQLQKRQTSSARKRLRLIGQRENRWMRDVNHRVSKALTESYPEGTLFVLEDLTGIRGATERVKAKDRYVTVSWAYYDLEQKLKYKASLNRQLMIKVNPAYTSQCCPKCGHIDRGNRDKKNHIFKCRACGYQSNDDRIAAMNLCGMGIKYLAESQESISLL